MIAFEDDVSTSLAKACELDSDKDAIHLARAVQIVRQHMFGEAKPFNEFPERCQEESVPKLLLALASIVLEGPSIKDQMVEVTTPAALAIAQMLKFNSIKHKRTQHAQGPTVSVRHSVAQETPVPMYIGLMLHTHTCKRELIDNMAHMGLSISYDRVLQLSTWMGNKVCQQFHHEQVVCPPKLRGNVFTTAAVDNIDHNLSSTTAKESFHGTAVSLFQHPSFAGEGLSPDIVIVAGSGDASSRMLDHLPHYCTEVPPVVTSMKKPSVPEARMVSLGRDGFKRQTEEEYLWLDNARQVVEDPDLMSLKPPALFLMEQPSSRC